MFIVECMEVVMKTVVITGSARGLGLEMAKCFRSKNYNVVISDLFKKDFPSIGCVELMHYLDNEKGKSLYESLGFKSTGEIRETIRPGTDYIDKELVRRYFY